MYLDCYAVYDYFSLFFCCLYRKTSHYVYVHFGSS